LTSCSGDASQDVECKLPLGAGSITVKALSFPISAGKTAIPVEAKVSSVIPASLASVDVHVTATDADAGDQLVCLDVHTKKQMEVQQQAGTLDVTWSDCGGRVTVTDLEPASIETGSTTTLTGEGQLDKDCAGATFDATVSAAGVKLTSCSGDASQDVECKLPLGAGSITVKALSFPISAGKTAIPVEAKVSSVIPASLASVDVHVTATDANAGDQLVCLDVHTKKASLGSTAVDCSTTACPSSCECIQGACDVDSCHADAACTAAESCAMACACGDDSCALSCAASNPSEVTNALLGCWQSNCKTVSV